MVILAGGLGAYADSPGRITPPLQMVVPSRTLLSCTARLRAGIPSRAKLLEVESMRSRPIIIRAHATRPLL